MISLIVPTRNRADTLRRCAPSYFAQELVDEVIVVDDAGDDDTAAVLNECAAQQTGVDLRIVTNPQRLGASQSRNVGVALARNDLILFCDDDEMLESGYARLCLEKMREHEAAAVSGRRVYMRPGETPRAALDRFGFGLRDVPAHQALICESVNGARFAADLEVPFTNAVILTRKELLQRFPFDPYYARGNGYREETDYQMNLYTQGHRIVVTNACHSIHLPLAEVRAGGQRTGHLKRIYWSIHYTNYFFGKYYEAYARRLGLRAPRWLALSAFSVFAVYRAYLRPVLYPFALALASRRRSAEALR